MNKLLFFSGIAIGLLGAAKIPQAAISLNLFILGVLLSTLGVWRLHREARQASVAEQQQEALNLAQTQNLFINLCQNLTHLEQQLHAEDKDHEKILNEINNLSNQYVIPLVALQTSVTQQLGRNAAADIYVAVAQGERLLNRMRSSLGDGCWFETYQVFPRMSAALQLASQRWQQHMDKHD